MSQLPLHIKTQEVQENVIWILRSASRHATGRWLSTLHKVIYAKSFPFSHALPLRKRFFEGTVIFSLPFYLYSISKHSPSE